MWIYHKIIIPFLIALQFLTTIPVHLPYLPNQEQNRLSVLFYPLIGLIIGGIIYLIAYFLSLPIIVLSIIMVIIWVWLTGGLHLDGLADTTDAWVGGYGDKQRTLTIMKDPNCGAMGVIAIVLTLALKWACVYSLLHYNQILGLLFIPMLARLSPLILFMTTPYVRANGIGSALHNIDKIPAILISLCAGTLLYFLGWQTALLLYLSTLISIFYLRWQFIRRIDGITGDTIGMSIETIEVVLLLSLVSSIYHLA